MDEQAATSSESFDDAIAWTGMLVEPPTIRCHNLGGGRCCPPPLPVEIRCGPQDPTRVRNRLREHGPFFTLVHASSLSPLGEAAVFVVAPDSWEGWLPLAHIGIVVDGRGACG